MDKSKHKSGVRKIKSLAQTKKEIFVKERKPNDEICMCKLSCNNYKTKA